MRKIDRSCQLSWIVSTLCARSSEFQDAHSFWVEEGMAVSLCAIMLNVQLRSSWFAVLSLLLPDRCRCFARNLSFLSICRLTWRPTKKFFSMFWPKRSSETMSESHVSFSTIDKSILIIRKISLFYTISILLSRSQVGYSSADYRGLERLVSFFKG